MVQGRWTYIMTNKPRGVLYVCVTGDLPSRIVRHREGTGSAFCRKYNLTRLVLAERREDIRDAIAREKALKAWQRASKIEHIERENPEWRDLFEVIL